MRSSILPGLGSSTLNTSPSTSPEHVILRQPLHRVLAFTRRTIHDVINNPVARNEVIGYYKLHCWVQRESEICELEKQWNSPSM